ncbi:hypothetical protein PCCS19_06920 [Paenibacillus sp. CCS19]|uniref:stalk domain-containing protein n=1 Tax=Paenibacillus sp. CCS19 TaxID=3158387 RepID=UPI002560B3D5|nr:stalk domain-containing protein [Paenibacillus cellulosilyticus]GMK37638.1 hypothetical protein PCCS19_06920 [Paenibacillus cellulosilyticus]
MKIKVAVFMLLLFFMANSFASAAAAANVVTPTFKIVIDNEELNLSAPPYVQNGTTMVPFRSIFTQLGLVVEWDAEHQQVVGRNSERTITLTVGSVTAQINDSTEIMPLAPVIHNGTTYIPLRFVGTASGGKVEFYGGGLNVVWILSAKQNQLVHAVITNEVADVDKLLESGADPTVMVGPVGPAIYDFVHDSIEIVKLFLKYGMDINYCDEDQYNSMTLLQHAAGQGYVELVKFLLDAGADPSLAAGFDWTALEIAEYWKDKVENGYQDIIDPANTPTVETYEEIIRLLTEAMKLNGERSQKFV